MVSQAGSGVKMHFDRDPDAEQAEVSRFLYSDRDSIGRQLSEEQADYFRNSKVRDENGNLRSRNDSFEKRAEVLSSLPPTPARGAFGREGDSPTA